MEKVWYLGFEFFLKALMVVPKVVTKYKQLFLDEYEHGSTTNINRLISIFDSEAMGFNQYCRLGVGVVEIPFCRVKKIKLDTFAGRSLPRPT